MDLKRLVKKFFKSKTALILTFAILIRFSLAPFTGHRYDMYIWRLNQALAYQYHVNPLNPPAEIDENATMFFWSYPPLWLFCLLAVYPVYAAIAHPVFPANPHDLWQDMYTFNNPAEAYQSFIPKNMPLLDLLIKTPLVLSDSFIALLLFKIVREIAGEKKARHYTYMWILNPFVIFISAIWGMFDTLPTLFTLLAVWLFLKRKLDKSALSLSAASLFKMYPILFAPILALVNYRRYGKINTALKYFLITIGLTFLIMFLANFCFAIIFGQKPLHASITRVWQLIKGRASPDWYGSNIFFGLTPLYAMSSLFKLLKIETNLPVSPILTGVAVTILLYKISREKNFDSASVFSYITIAHFAIYLTYTVVNEQYLIWILPFLLVLAAAKENLKVEFIFWTISLLSALFILTHYRDLSYFISPYFVPGYPGYLPALVIFGFVAALVYALGIVFVFKKDRGRVAELAETVPQF